MYATLDSLGDPESRYTTHSDSLRTDIRNMKTDIARLERRINDIATSFQRAIDILREETRTSLSHNITYLEQITTLVLDLDEAIQYAPGGPIYEEALHHYLDEAKNTGEVHNRENRPLPKIEESTMTPCDLRQETYLTSSNTV